MDEESHLKALGLGPRATAAHVERAYRALVKRWHPDQFVDDPLRFRLANERLVSVVTAYRALKAARDEPGDDPAAGKADDPAATAAAVTTPRKTVSSYRLVGQKDVRIRIVPLGERGRVAFVVLGVALLLLAVQAGLWFLTRRV